MLSTDEDVNHHGDARGIPLKSEEIGEFIRRGRAAQEAADEILSAAGAPNFGAIAPEAALMLVRDAVKDARINIESAMAYTKGMRFDLVRALCPGLEVLKSVLEGGERAIALQVAWEKERLEMMQPGDDDVAGEGSEAPQP